MAKEPEVKTVEVPVGMVRLRHSDGVVSFSYGGQTYVTDDKGEVLVPVAAAEPMRSHGFEVT